MSSIEENGGTNMVMPVAPMNQYGGGNGMFGNNGNDNGWWIILLFIVLLGARNGNGFGSGNGGVVMPYVPDQSQAIQAGFNQAALTTGIGNISQDICNGFAGVNSNLQNGFFQAEIANNNRQIAEMQTNFALQTQFQNCCCENRLGLANLQSQIYQENCADRQAINDALMNVTQQMNAGFQSIRNEFCQDRLDRKDETIAELRQQLNERDRLASQNAQTAAILANNEAQTTALEQYLAPVPRPAYIVQNPNCCGNNYGYGCCGNVA